MPSEMERAFTFHLSMPASSLLCSLSSPDRPLSPTGIKLGTFPIMHTARYNSFGVYGAFLVMYHRAFVNYTCLSVFLLLNSGMRWTDHKQYSSTHVLKNTNLALSCCLIMAQFHINPVTTTQRNDTGSSHFCWSMNELTFASGVTTGFGGNCTSVALRIVFSCRISCWDWLWPKGCHIKTE